jgi:hypothetical protein
MIEDDSTDVYFREWIVHLTWIEEQHICDIHIAIHGHTHAFQWHIVNNREQILYWTIQIEDIIDNGRQCLLKKITHKIVRLMYLNMFVVDDFHSIIFPMFKNIRFVYDSMCHRDYETIVEYVEDEQMLLSLWNERDWRQETVRESNNDYIFSCVRLFGYLLRNVVHSVRKRQVIF